MQNNLRVHFAQSLSAFEQDRKFSLQKSLYCYIYVEGFKKKDRIVKCLEELIKDVGKHYKESLKVIKLGDDSVEIDFPK